MSNGASISKILNPSISAIIIPIPDDENAVERIAFRKVKASLAIVDPDPEWPSNYNIFASRITEALGQPGGAHLVSVSHVGSTSVPGLPAKACIDIDIVVPSINNEEAYVPALEAQGFQFLLREPKWYNHRFFVATEPDPAFANVHVWGPACPETERHRIFRDWLRENVEDRDLYAKVKREASAASIAGGETLVQYNNRKADVIKSILQRAFKALGYI